MLADLAAACMLLLSIYAHLSLGREIQDERRVFVTRVLLATVGTMLGLFAVGYARWAAFHDTSAVALFLIGFGQVHAPAAVILLRKSQRAEQLISRREPRRADRRPAIDESGAGRRGTKSRSRPTAV
jgi:hypothetical protein